MLPHDLDPELTEPQLSNRVISAVLHQLEQEVDAADVDAVVVDAGLPRSYVDDTTGWVSMAYVRRLAGAVARLHGLDGLPPHDHEMWQLWRRAGRRGIDRSVIGPIFQVLEAFGSPGQIFRRIPQLAGRATRSTWFEVRSVTRGRAIIAARPGPDSALESLESPNCWFQHGFFEGIPTLFGLPEARIEHRECMLDARRPASECVYRIQYAESRSRFVSARLLNVAIGAALVGGIAFALGAPHVWLAVVAGASIATAVDGWWRYMDARRHLRSEAQDLQRLLRAADHRHGQLWREQVALKRSVLAARKLSGYLASDLVERILDDPELELTLGGMETVAAVLFCDIVSFTPRCEQLEAAEIVEQLNVYFSHVDRAFSDHRGVIDKRMGDGIMAVFVPVEGDATPVALRALRSGLDILRHVKDCNEELAALGAEPFQIRVGVAAGELVQGNMGSDVKLEYTVIGDVVNLAARLEGQATPGHLLAPHDFLELLPEQELESLTLGERRTITVKGRAKPVDVQDVRP